MRNVLRNAQLCCIQPGLGLAVGISTDFRRSDGSGRGFKTIRHGWLLGLIVRATALRLEVDSLSRVKSRGPKLKRSARNGSGKPFSENWESRRGSGVAPKSFWV
jgi:hypothetical protein